MDAITKLSEMGQSVWLDFIDDEILSSGELDVMIDRYSLRGVTSNPTIFQKALASSRAYEGIILDSPAADTDAVVFERVMVHDIVRACDKLSRVYDPARSNGFASIEVSPLYARDTDASIVAARRLWRAVSRPNVMVKIPGTREGLPAIEQCLADGMNINITLLFSTARYEEVAEAHMRGLERRLANGEPIDRVSSVASFFVSRVDAKVDKMVQPELRGRVAIANAKVAYASFLERMQSDRWKNLRDNGAQPQRLLWASTTPKDSSYSDIHYVEGLAGPDTVDTMTRDTFMAYLDHGEPEPRLTRELEDARTLIGSLDLAPLLVKLEEEGIASFAESYVKALEMIVKVRRSRELQLHP